jgi:hypothetical protein
MEQLATCIAFARIKNGSHHNLFELKKERRMMFLALPLLFVCRLSSILLAVVALSIAGFPNVSLLYRS